MSLPRILITGASGFVGRHLLDVFKDHYRIYGLARRSQARSGAPVHPNITWYQTDIAERDNLERVFNEIAEDGGAEILIHLAAHYDFSGEDHPEYYRTNVDGLRNVLDLSESIGIRHFIFSSSVAASRFPVGDAVLDEESVPDGDHIYAKTKRIGEEMLAEYRDRFHSVIVRFAALFSDYCEYPPLYMFLETWLSGRWNRRVLGGKGKSAIPYLHVREIPPFFHTLFDRLESLGPEQILIASPDTVVSHMELFDAACREFLGHRVDPIKMPRAMCGPGMLFLDWLGRLWGERPFERPWMAGYIDLQMNVDSSRSRQLLGWEPRSRLEILRRMPFMIENLKSDPYEWHWRNQAAMKEVHLRSYLRIHQLLEAHEQEIAEEFTRHLTSPTGQKRFPRYQTMNPEQRLWYTKLILHQLMNAVRTRERAIFSKYCGDLAARRFNEGFKSHEVCEAVELLNLVSFKVLLKDEEARELKNEMIDHITVTLRAGCDNAQEVFETLEAQTAWREGRKRA